MSKNLQKCLSHLQVIAAIKDDKTRKKVLTDYSCNECIYKALREVAVNTVNKKLPLSKRDKNKLRYKDKIIRQLAKKQKNKKRRQQLVVQSGGALPILIPIAATLIGELISHGLLSKSSGASS